MKKIIVLFSALSISILVLAGIATKNYLNGADLGKDPLITLFSFYAMGIFFGGVAVFLLKEAVSKKIDNEINDAFKNFDWKF